jgi:hypothetical protein
MALREIQLRGAQNQSLFRDVNARVEELKGASLPRTEIDFVCECADESCFVPVTLTQDEYLSIRSKAARFFVVPEHVDARIERVVSKHPTYWIVEKIEAGKPVAEAVAPADSEQSGGAREGSTAGPS